MAVATPVEYSWDAEDEIQLFFALDGLRPFGHNKHFNMALLVERLMNKLGKDINSSLLWSKLKTMYNLPALDEIEPNPIDFDEEIDFTLPESYLNHKQTSNIDSTDDVEEESESKSESGSKSETPVNPMPTASSNNTLAVVKEVEMTRTRNSTPARQLQELSNEKAETNTSSTGSGSSTVKRTQPKRTRASTSTNDTPSSSPSTPTPGTKRRRI